jgi:hypothetical protein
MYLALRTNVNSGAELLCYVDAERMESLLAGVTVAIISLIRTLQGFFGVGRLGKSTLNSVFSGMLIDIRIYILLLTT